MTKEEWQAIKNKDARSDGEFVYVNRSTGIISKPSCDAQTVQPEQIILFPALKDAIAAGYRPCDTCFPGHGTSRNTRADLAAAVAREIQEHYTETFSLDKLAESLHINKFYLLRTFRLVTGETPLEYHNRYRCDKAKELLKQPELNISYIAFETGFNSASHFSRRFRAVTGMTPSEYRREYLKSLDE